MRRRVRFCFGGVAFNYTKWDKHLRVLARSLIACTTLALPATARAQGELPPPSLSTQESTTPRTGQETGNLPPPKLRRRQDLAITVDQLDTFADLLGESEERVEWRLRHDLEIVPIAAAAADTRRARQRLGRNAMILGFATVGLGGTVGVLGVLASGPGFPGESPRSNEQTTKSHFTTDVIGLVLVGLGLVTATYGIIRVAAQTDIETEAVDRYKHSERPPPLVSSTGISRTLSVSSGGKELGFSIGPFRF
jgi:hypothetical protein